MSDLITRPAHVALRVPDLEDHRFANLWGAGPPLEMMATATPKA
jgi:hypothetical protein